MEDYIDLGLPSGTLWATCNVGADRPEQYGEYFAWGETMPKNTYNPYTYAFGAFPCFSKYCDDGKAELDLEDDAARANMGGSFHMPTKSQIDELMANTTFEWENCNGVACGKFTSKVNRESIIFPTAGRCEGPTLYGKGRHFHIWSSSPINGIDGLSWSLYGACGPDIFHDLRYFGCSVRGVIG